MTNTASTFIVQCTGDVSDGLLTQLTQSKGINLIDSGLIRLNMPTQCDPLMKKSAILGQWKEQSFYNYAMTFPKSSDNWVGFDFRNLRIQLSAYSIRGNDRYIMQDMDVD
jgi:hypothetical protein